MTAAPRRKTRRKEPADFHRLAEERGFVWIGPEVPNTRAKTGWRCARGHEWTARYNTIQQGRGCPHCAYDSQRHPPEEYHVLAAEFGGKWLGPPAKNIFVRTMWECSEGHRWLARYHYVRQGYGCPECKAAARRVPPEDYHALAEERGFEWLGPPVPNAGTKTRWRCPVGHEWDIQYHKIQQGNGCLYCSGKVPKTPEDYYDLARERGFEWLGPEVPTVVDETNWRCQHGHEWAARYNNIQQGTGCPYCVDRVNRAPVSQQQRHICDLLGGVLNYEYQGKYIDIALTIDGISIAVEYDGWFWHGARQEEDTLRTLALIGDGWRVLRIKSGASIPPTADLNEAIERLKNGALYHEIVLDDWGQGPIREESH